MEPMQQVHPQDLEAGNGNWQPMMPQQLPPPPAYGQTMAFTPSYVGQFPNYYRPTVIPDGVVLTPHTVKPLDHPTNATYKRTGTGDIVTFDANLDYDEQELWRFFMTHLEKPKMSVRIYGWHPEQRTVTETRDGQTHTRTETVHVTDFDFHVDMSHYVSPAWTRIMCVPEKDGDKPKTFEETLKEYVKSEASIKEIKMKKQSIWEYQKISQAIEYSIRQLGYPHKVEISFPTEADEKLLVAMPYHHYLSLDHFCSHFLNDAYSRLIIGKKASNQIVCDYQVIISPEEFFAKNYYLIQQNCAARTKDGGPIQAF